MNKIIATTYRVRQPVNKKEFKDKIMAKLGQGKREFERLMCQKNYDLMTKENEGDALIETVINAINPDPLNNLVQGLKVIPTPQKEKESQDRKKRLMEIYIEQAKEYGYKYIEDGELLKSSKLLCQGLKYARELGAVKEWVALRKIVEKLMRAVQVKDPTIACLPGCTCTRIDDPSAKGDPIYLHVYNSPK